MQLTFVPQARNFNPRSPRGGATSYSSPPYGYTVISIHAPHEGERRAQGDGKDFAQRDFNPRSPRGGATASGRHASQTQKHFNPRSPRGGATWIHLPPRHCGGYFNPRSPRGGATFNSLIVFVQLEISIHAPHEGERLLCIKNQIFISVFQSTLPTRGSDVLSNYCKCLCKNFNPRSPRGGATMMSCVSASLGRFQSTLPTRGSDDVPHFALGEAVPISIHAPHEGERHLIL